MVRWGHSFYDPSEWYYVKAVNNGITSGIHADTPANLLKIGSAPGTNEAGLSGPVSVPAGGLFTLTFSLGTVEADVYANAATIRYDPSLLQYIASDSLEEGYTVLQDTEKPGKVDISGRSANGAGNGPIDLLALRFKAKKPLKSNTAVVDLTDVVITDLGGNQLKLDGGKPYQVEITEP
jgi:hypothetical protein